MPTLLGMANVDATTRAEFARGGPDPLLSNPSGQDVHAAHESILFTYRGPGTVDSGLFNLAAEAKAAGNKPISALVRNRYVADLKKRGSVRIAFEGRYKFTRYFSPLDQQQAENARRPLSRQRRRALRPQGRPWRNDQPRRGSTTNNKLVETMIGKLEGAIAAEIGVDDGRELPYIPLVDMGG